MPHYIELKKENNYYKIINPLQVLGSEVFSKVTIGLYKEQNYLCISFTSFASSPGDDRFYFIISPDAFLIKKRIFNFEDVDLFSARKININDDSEWVMEKCNFLKDNLQCYYYTYENRENGVLQIIKATEEHNYLRFYEVGSSVI